MTESTAQIGSCRLAYEVFGQGPPVLLAHGFGLDRGSMRELADSLAAKYRVVVFDWRGHGATQSPQEDSAFSYPILRDDLIGLMDALSIERAHLAGQSMGGQICLLAALASPARIASLVTMGAGPCRNVSDPKEEKSWRSGAAFFETAPQEKLVDALVASAPPAEPDRDLARLRSMYAAARGGDLARMIRGAFLTVQSNDEQCRALSLPVLVLAGESDRQWLEPSRKLHSLIPASRFVQITGAGHLAVLDRPQPVCEAIREFLDDVERGEAVP